MCPIVTLVSGRDPRAVLSGWAVGTPGLEEGGLNLRAPGWPELPLGENAHVPASHIFGDRLKADQFAQDIRYGARVYPVFQRFVTEPPTARPLQADDSRVLTVVLAYPAGPRGLMYAPEIEGSLLTTDLMQARRFTLQEALVRLGQGLGRFTAMTLLPGRSEIERWVESLPC